MHNVPGAYSKYAPGAYLKCTMLQEHVANMFLEQCTFKKMLLEYIELRILPQIIYAHGAAVSGTSAPGA